MSKYEIGGVCVEMTSFAADRWNAAETTEHDLRSAIVHDAKRDRWISLRRATNARLEPTIAAMLADSPANQTN